MTRSDEVIQVLRSLEAAYQAWGKSDTPYITQTLEMSVDDFLEFCAAGSIPYELRPLFKAVDRMESAWADWKRDVEVGGDQVILPTNGFWKALEAVFGTLRQMEEPPPPELEPIAVFDRQNVPDHQICSNYGFVDAHGRPDLKKLREERAEPGRHTGPGTGWLPPNQKKRLEDRKRQEEILEQSRQRIAAKLAAAGPRLAADDILTLVRQDVSGQQIATMKGISVEDVNAACDAAGVPRPKVRYELPAVGEAPHDRDRHESDERLDEQIGKPKRTPKPRPEPETEPEDEGNGDIAGETIEDQILEMAAAGTSKEVIQATLSTPDAPLSKHKITQVLKRAQLAK